MRISYRTYWLPKSGLSAEEYEDAFAPEQANAELDVHEFRCAVSDGATETSFSGQWARILCNAYNKKDFDLTKLQNEWKKEVSQKDLPWYAEQKLESGAFASLIGLSIQEKEDGLSWSMRALGDSCLFHLRAGEILKASPISNWQSFDYTPLLISTQQSANVGIRSKLLHERSSCVKGDLFYLMTDAISKWFLRRQSEQGDAINWLESIQTDDQFQTLVDEQRHERDDKGLAMMPNDDVTWTRVAIV